MSFFKENIKWMVPTAAILIVGFGFMDRIVGLLPLDANTPSELAEEAPTPNNDVQALSALVDASMGDDAATSAQIASEPVTPEVTRKVPVDLLQTAVVAPETEPLAQPVVAKVPTPQVDTDQAAAFFDRAKSNLAVANACEENLGALADQARVYFPAGGLSGEQAGVNAALLIGQVLRDCPGYAIQVEGHSDPSGDPAANQRLSEKRANTVLSRLKASGVDTSQFSAIGYGDTRPSGVTGPKGDAYYDRRVEFAVVKSAQNASFATQATGWNTTANTAASGCAQQLDAKASQMRQFYAPGAITVSGTDLDAVVGLAVAVTRCDGTRLRLVGHHADNAGTREDAATGRLRALAMMSALGAAGLPTEKILIGAPSYSIGILGQPGLPSSRVDFQVIQD